MAVDRSLQRSILAVLDGFYPNGAEDIEYIPRLYPELVIDHQAGLPICSPIKDCQFYKEVHHLEEVGFIETGNPFNGCLRLTAQGRDFLEDDGGLSAILNTVTVKFDADNIRSLIEQGLLKSGLPEEKTGILRKALNTASSTALQTATSSLMQLAMSDPMKAIKAVASALGVNL